MWRSNRSRIWLVLVLMCVLCPSLATAQSVDPNVYVPPQLKPWVPWVLHGQQERVQCAHVDGGMVCQWPAQLSMEVFEKQGRFTLDVWTDANSTILLPGDARHWPQSVQVNAEPVVVRQNAQLRATVKLGRGQHRITGLLPWTKPPEVITVPGDVASVSLTVLGKRIASPRVDEKGRLWIREGGTSAAVSDADVLRTSIYRKLIDGVPLKTTTLLELNVSGRAREVEMGKVLLPDTRPAAIRSALPVQVTADGKVKVYVRPGTHKIEIDAYLPAPVTTLRVPKLSRKDVDAQEIWVWQPDEALRSVVLSGLPSVDPSRTTLPRAWRGTVTMLAKPGSVLSLKTSRRGLEMEQPNLIHLKRTLWLDLDGNGYTFKDALSGKLNKGWRIHFGDVGELGRVTKDKTNDDLLITEGPTKRAGVELRQRKLDLSAEGRYNNTRQTLSIVGWHHNVQSLQATLHLPPGWSLLGVSGVDQVNNTWIDSWSLFEFFILLLISFAMGRLFGWPWGLVAGVAMVLAHGHHDAPRYVWFHLIAALGLLRLLPLERVWLRRVALGYLGVSCVGFLMIFGPFAQKQIRYGMYPQVQRAHTRSFSNISEGKLSSPVSKVSKDISILSDEKEEISNIQQKVGNKFIRRGSVRNAPSIQFSSKKQTSNDWLDNSAYQQIDPNEVVQTGPGLPNWRWDSWTLRWNGPVVQDHKVRLWLLSPKVNMLLRWLSVFFFLLMILAMVHPKRFAVNTLKDSRFDLWTGLKRLLVPGAVILCSFAPLADAQAQTPVSNEMLTELRTRLIKTPECVAGNRCLVVSRLNVNIDDQKVKLSAELHAQANTAWNIPGPVNVLVPVTVKIDGVETRQLRRGTDQMIAVRVPKGRHSIEVEGRLLSKTVATVQFDPKTKPQFVEISTQQWSVDGIDEFGKPANSLQLSRIQTKKDKKAVDQTQTDRELPPWYFVQRVVSLSLPWQTTTIVTREQTDRPQLVKLPLLSGESVITDGIRVENKEALVYFGRGVNSVQYKSELSVQKTIKLVAAKNKPWTETWMLECTRIWHCEYKGINPVHVVGEQGVFEPMWKPWPGESITLSVSKPRGIPGAGSTVDEVTYLIEPGKRLMRATLQLRVRASQGGRQTLTLPKEAQVQEVYIDGALKSIQPRNGKLELPIKPGTQRFKVQWQQPTKSSLINRAPVIDLGSSAVNIQVKIKAPRQRWLLWTSGPSWGPAVLFWSHLVWMLLLAIILGRMKHLPVRTYQWVLLVLGMSQLPIVAVVPIVAWFTLLCWRQTRVSDNWAIFNVNQLAILFVSLVTAGVLYAAVHVNLLVDVDMQVKGNNSTNSLLKWYVDRSISKTPEASVFSVPLLVWRGAMLLWALWLVSQLLRWLPWAWKAFGYKRYWMMPTPTPVDLGPTTVDVATSVAPSADGSLGVDASPANASTSEPADTQGEQPPVEDAPDS